MVYSQENITNNKFRRVFTENVDNHELVWHRDYENREVFVESSDGWMLQMDNELPQVLQEGQKYIIPKETYHRVIKGTGDLILTIEESHKVRIPKAVKKQVKKGLMYSRKSFSHYLMNEMISLDEIKELKTYFDSKSKSISLNENYKGNPSKDPEYIDWLLHGGNHGYQWVINVLT